jgi:hypothetical protein
MSYSFSAQAATKAELKSKVAEQLAAVVAAQPMHAADRSQAQVAADAFIDLLADNNTESDFAASVSGALMWNSADDTQQANVSVTAFFATRK